MKKKAIALFMCLCLCLPTISVSAQELTPENGTEQSDAEEKESKETTKEKSTSSLNKKTSQTKKKTTSGEAEEVTGVSNGSKKKTQSTQNTQKKTSKSTDNLYEASDNKEEANSIADGAEETEKTPEELALEKKFSGLCVEEGLESRNGKPLILDMDFSTDVDDACALRVAASLHNQGYITLRCVSLCTTSEDEVNVRAAHGLLKYQGLGDVMIGTSMANIIDTSPYWETAAYYSNGVINKDTAVRQWRKVVAQSTRKVDIVTTGYLTNLKWFCESKPDDISAKSGLEMVREDIGNIYIVGGTWTSGTDNNFSYCWDARDAVKWMSDNLLRPIIFITNEVGGPVVVGRRLQEKDVNQDDPLTKCLYDFGTSAGRAGWDPMGVFIAAHINTADDLRTYGFTMERCDFVADESGAHIFTPNEDGQNYKVSRDRDDYNMYSTWIDELCILK